MIEKQSPRWIISYQMFFIPPFYATQMINPFLDSRISDNHDKVDKLSANDEILVKDFVFLL